MKLKSDKGSAVLTTPLVIAIALFMLALLLIFVVNILMPFIWYEKLSAQSLKYIFVMEEYGYLTADERDNLLNDLSTGGFDAGKVTIKATDSPVNYGEPIFLNIDYAYNMRLPVLNTGSLSAVNQDNEVQMSVRRQSVSKR